MRVTPHQLDILMNGAFIYERPDGSRYASLDYKLREYGIPCVGRTGKMSETDIHGPPSEYLARCNASLFSPFRDLLGDGIYNALRAEKSA